MGRPIWDKLMVDAPLDDALARARANGVPLFVNDVDVGSGERAPKLCNIQVAPLVNRQGAMLILIEPREYAGRMRRNSTPRQPRNPPSAWPRCWPTKSRTLWRASPGPRSSSA